MDYTFTLWLINTILLLLLEWVEFQNCPKTYPCCGEGNQTFEHWIFKCDALASFRWNSLNFIDDFYVLFIRKIRAFNPLSSYISISYFEYYINHYIYLFLLGRTLVLNELHFDSGEQRQLNELLFKGSSESPIPKIVGLAEFLTRAIPIISSSFELLFDRYCKIPNLTKSVDVVLLRHNDNTGSSSISTKGESRPSSSINDESGESLVDTTLSILKMLLLGLITLLFVRKGKIPAWYNLPKYIIFLSFFIFYFLNFFFFIFIFK